MNRLTPGQRTALHASLEQRKLALLRQVAARPGSRFSRIPAIEEVETSPADSASNRTLNQLEAEADELLQAQLSSIRHALAKFDSGSEGGSEGGYGECEHCGEPIGYSRLEARPDARFCIACQTRLERPRR